MGADPSEPPSGFSVVKDSLRRDREALFGATREAIPTIASDGDDDASGSMSREELRDAIHKIQNGGADNPRAAGALERAFDAWLHETFVPAALKAATKKKLMAATAAG